MSFKTSIKCESTLSLSLSLLILIQISIYGLWSLSDHDVVRKRHFPHDFLNNRRTIGIFEPITKRFFMRVKFLDFGLKVISDSRRRTTDERSASRLQAAKCCPNGQSIAASEESRRKTLTFPMPFGRENNNFIITLLFFMTL